ncbi:hypothetical protein AC579_8169 [Pseudocercospora musae]|uniref:Uncharacterized protein n=1 Tax=Pseudocercospora musae TaxID=113226 RepID=A0A139IUM9_9PEZI|nr:hypothetical protein AC579_8169 [Pseudocercospora musae]
MASSEQAATQWLDDDTRVDVYALFVLDARVTHAMVEEVIAKNEGDEDYYLWLADSYDKLPEIDKEQRTMGTVPPLNASWQSPFIAKGIQDAAEFVQNAPKPLCKVFFAVLQKDLYENDDKVMICRIVNGEVQAIPCTTKDVTNLLLGHDRDTWEESFRRWREEGDGLAVDLNVTQYRHGDTNISVYVRIAISRQWIQHAVGTGYGSGIVSTSTSLSNSLTSSIDDNTNSKSTTSITSSSILSSSSTLLSSGSTSPNSTTSYTRSVSSVSSDVFTSTSTMSVPLGTGTTTSSQSVSNSFKLSSISTTSSSTTLPANNSAGTTSSTSMTSIDSSATIPGGVISHIPTTTSTATTGGFITSTMTTLPTGVSTEIIHPTGITTNTWITTTKDSSTTIVPAIWCTSCGPNEGDGLVVIWGFPLVTGVDFSWGSIFPGLPTFNLPCIRVFGVQVAGDCPNPDSKTHDSDDGDDNQSSTTSSDTSTSSTSTSTESCTQSTTASDCRIGCSVSYSSTASSLSSTTVCYTTSCYQTVGCSLRPTTSSTISTPSPTASACALLVTANEYDAWATYSSLGLAIPAWMDAATIPLPTNIDSDDDIEATTTGGDSNGTVSTSSVSSTSAPVNTTQAANSTSSITSAPTTPTQFSNSTITSAPASSTFTGFARDRDELRDCLPPVLSLSSPSINSLHNYVDFARGGTAYTYRDSTGNHSFRKHVCQHCDVSSMQWIGRDGSMRYDFFLCFVGGNSNAHYFAGTRNIDDERSPSANKDANPLRDLGRLSRVYR